MDDREREELERRLAEAEAGKARAVQDLKSEREKNRKLQDSLKSAAKPKNLFRTCADAIKIRIQDVLDRESKIKRLEEENENLKKEGEKKDEQYRRLQDENFGLLYKDGLPPEKKKSSGEKPKKKGRISESDFSRFDLGGMAESMFGGAEVQVDAGIGSQAPSDGNDIKDAETNHGSGPIQEAQEPEANEGKDAAGSKHPGPAEAHPAPKQRVRVLQAARPSDGKDAEASRESTPMQEGRKPGASEEKDAAIGEPSGPAGERPVPKQRMRTKDPAQSGQARRPGHGLEAAGKPTLSGSIKKDGAVDAQPDTEVQVLPSDGGGQPSTGPSAPSHSQPIAPQTPGQSGPQPEKGLPKSQQSVTPQPPMASAQDDELEDDAWPVHSGAKDGAGKESGKRKDKKNSKKPSQGDAGNAKPEAGKHEEKEAEAQPKDADGVYAVDSLPGSPGPLMPDIPGPDADFGDLPDISALGDLDGLDGLPDPNSGGGADDVDDDWWD